MDTFPISADIDGIIEIVRGAGGKGVDIREISSFLGKSVPDTEKWVRVLEEQGVLKVEHRLMRVHIYWTGKEVSASSAHERAIEHKDGQLEPFIAQDAPKEPLAGREIDKESGFTLQQVEELLLRAQKIREMKQGEQTEVTVAFEQEVQSKAGEESKSNKSIGSGVGQTQSESSGEAQKKSTLQKKKEASFKEKTMQQKLQHKPRAQTVEEEKIEAAVSQGKDEELKVQQVHELAQIEKEIMERLGGLEKAIDGQIERAQQQEEKRAQIAKDAQMGEFTQQEAGFGKIEGPEGISQAAGSEIAIFAPSKITVSMVPRRVDVGIARFSGKLGEHLKAVNGVAQEIEELNLSKQKIAREIYAPLEKKLESEMEVLATRLLQKEKTLMELRARAAQIPIAAGELGERHEKMAQIEKQMKGIVDESGIIIEEAREQVAQAMQEVQQKAEETRRALNSQYVRFEELKNASKEAQAAREQVEKMLEEAHAQLAEGQQRVAMLDGNAAKLAQMGEETKEGVARIWKDIGRQQAALSNMQEQLHRLAEVDRWASENQLGYKRNMMQISEFVKNNEAEYLGLREEIEANFVRRYLRELRTITDSYEYEIGEAVRMEKGVDERIMDAKKRMEEMVQEGKRMAYLYELQLKEESKEAYDEQKLKREKMFRVLSASGGKRSQVEQMIGEIIGNVEQGGRKAQHELEQIQMQRQAEGTSEAGRKEKAAPKSAIKHSKGIKKGARKAAKGKAKVKFSGKAKAHAEKGSGQKKNSRKEKNRRQG